jgi:hypothetical protein
MQSPFQSSTGIAYPDDLKLLKQIFDRVCRKNHFAEGGSDSQDVAHAAMSLFSSGISTEDELTARLEEFVERRMFRHPRQ